MLIGCHVSIAGGIDKAPERASSLGAEAMQIFTRSPRGGNAPEITDGLLESFQRNISEYKIRLTVVHTPYYINLASENNRIRYGSAKVIREELERASLLGARYVMTHLGSAGEMEKDAAIEKTIEMFRKSLDGYAGSAELLIENSAGAGKIIGDNFLEISRILKGVAHPKLTGTCLDTQHSFASGYDWRDTENTLGKIGEEIGLEKIKLIHANDSKTAFASKKDRHEHIGKGEIGLGAFEKIIAFAKEHDISMILETEHDAVKEDIALLKGIRHKK
ncbi:MAG: deoxyribonuclease IV [Candidatus Moranbacteria bacterium]|nr:deoxyribonuclease IV [Candidatus Moranbacteria bacterium]